MLGKVLNNRYKIIKELGQGGMAIVFEAQDLLLDRKVAIKMLRPEYVHDKDFVKKFRHEAKAVARLSHPNVVNIFDIGEDEQHHYLVMEDVEGKNLKDIIKERGKLTIVESLDIANQICAALAVAHKNDIIHCDIKPHNILVTPDKKVKVTDFGIARAATSSTVTITDTVVGSAHYFSPEQARGGEIKARSDLYSLGIVLYEMLTGEVPFKGDSPISVALKHIQEKPKLPSLINPEIPAEVEKLVIRAIAKEPEARFSNANEMREEITTVLKSYRREKREDGVHIFNDEGDTRILKRSDIDKAKNLENDKATSKRKRAYLSEPDKINRSYGWIKWLVLLIILLTASVIGIFFFYQNYMEVPIVEVPDLIGMEFKEAKEVAAQVGLHLETQNEGVHHPEIPEGHIISQFPLGGERVRQTRPILITISKGPAILTAPDLINKSLREAIIILENQKLIVGEKEYVYDNNINEGNIISQEPAPGEEVKAESRVNLVISKGPQPEMVSVPNLIGLTRQEAMAKIEESKLKVGKIEERMTKRFKVGQVASQQYSAGTEIPENSSIDLVISKGLINTKGGKIHTVTIKFTVLEGSPEQEIKIVVSDDNGKDVIYQAVHKPGDFIRQTVNSVGPTTYEVYSNGSLIAKEIQK